MGSLSKFGRRQKMTSAPAAASYGPELLVGPADFSNAAWIKTRTTVTADNAAASGGGMTADTAMETAITGTHRLHQAGIRQSGARYRYEVVLKANGRDLVDLEMSDNLTGQAGALFNLPVPDATDTGDATWTSSTRSIVALAGGFFRCVIEATGPALGTDFIAAIGLRNAGFATSYLGDVTLGIILESASFKKVL